MSTVPALGDERTCIVCDQITRTQIVQYACASGDLSLLHVDEPAARAAGYPGVMAHGMLTMALTAKVITNWFGLGALHRIKARFTAPVWPGDLLTARAVVRVLTPNERGIVVGLDLRCTNQLNVTVLEGSADVTIGGGETCTAGCR